MWQFVTRFTELKQPWLPNACYFYENILEASEQSDANRIQVEE